MVSRLGAFFFDFFLFTLFFFMLVFFLSLAVFVLAFKLSFFTSLAVFVFAFLILFFISLVIFGLGLLIFILSLVIYVIAVEIFISTPVVFRVAPFKVHPLAVGVLCSYPRLLPLAPGSRQRRLPALLGLLRLCAEVPPRQEDARGARAAHGLLAGETRPPVVLPPLSGARPESTYRRERV